MKKMKFIALLLTVFVLGTTSMADTKAKATVKAKEVKGVNVREVKGVNVREVRNSNANSGAVPMVGTRQGDKTGKAGKNGYSRDPYSYR